MKLDLSKPFDLNKAKLRFYKLCQKGAKIELTEFLETSKTPSQHRYVHACFGILADHLGYRLESIKQKYKRMFAEEYPDLGLYEDNGEWFIKSFADGSESDKRVYNKKESSAFIEWMIMKASEMDIDLPDAETYRIYRFEIEKELQHIL